MIQKLDFRRNTGPVKHRHFFNIIRFSTTWRIFGGVPQRLGRCVQPIVGFVGLATSVVRSCRNLFASFDWLEVVIALWHFGLLEHTNPLARILFPFELSLFTNSQSKSGRRVDWSPTGPRKARPDDRLLRNPPFAYDKDAGDAFGFNPPYDLNGGHGNSQI